VREYEFTFIVQPEISDEGLEGVCQKFEGILEKQGATRLFYEDWGRRRLAYEIQKFQKGHYLVLHFLDDGKCVPELERAARLDDSTLRFLTVLHDEEVADVAARVAEAAKLEEERVKKAEERVAREAEEAAARAAEAEARAEQEAAAAEKAASEAEAASSQEAGEAEAASSQEAGEAEAESSQKVDEVEAESPQAADDESEGKELAS
jgi:small subunit ribosomal protein S6